MAAEKALQHVSSAQCAPDTHAREKKRLRQENREFFQSQSANIPTLDLPERANPADQAPLPLEPGRPRMSAAAVFSFMMLRGFLASLISKPARCILLESMSLHDSLHRHGLKRPGKTTMLENVNAVSSATRNYIIDCQIELVL